MDIIQICNQVFSAAELPALLVGDENILAVNSSFLERMGCQRKDVVGHPIFNFFPANQPDGGPSTAQWRSHSLQDPDTVEELEFPFLLHSPDGNNYPTLVLIKFLDFPGQPLQLIQFSFENGGFAAGSGEVGSEQRWADNPHLESLGLLAGGVAHDFNNYLLAIMGNADLLDRDLAAGKSGDELLSEIRKAAGRAADLCHQLLAYSGNAQPNFQSIDLTATVQEMVPMLKLAISRKIVLHLDLEQNIPLVEVDLAQLHQVIMNLVVNASEAVGNRAGTITLITGMADCAQDSQGCFLTGNKVDEAQAYLEIRDDGDGISQDILNRIFDPYFSTKVRGRGLGLASVLGTIRCHQGNIYAKSTAGQGTAIRVCFPIQSPLESSLGPPEVKAPGKTGKGHILVVDDEEYIRALCSRMLGRLGFTTIVARDGAQALELYQNNMGVLDGVILDLVMPRMDGVEVLERLQSIDPQVRVIMTSGFHPQEIATRLDDLSIRGFIQKPYVMSDLAAVLGKLELPESTI